MMVVNNLASIFQLFMFACNAEHPAAQKTQTTGCLQYCVNLSQKVQDKICCKLILADIPLIY